MKKQTKINLLLGGIGVIALLSAYTFMKRLKGRPQTITLDENVPNTKDKNTIDKVGDIIKDTVGQGGTKDFDPSKDGDIIYDMLRGWTSDEDSHNILALLKARTKQERKSIENYFNSKYDVFLGGKLQDWLKSDMTDSDWEEAKKLF